jgi:hemolysin activation/secretion protein
MKMTAMTNVRFDKRYALGGVALLWSGWLGNVFAAGDETAFAVHRYSVEGNTLLPESDVLATLKPYTGAQRRFTDIQKALEALEALFREAGYGEVSVSIPEQELTAGVVRLRVIAPRLKSVALHYNSPETQSHYPEANIRAALPDLREGETLRIREIAKNLQLSNENPARKMEVVLRTSETPGELDAGVKIDALPPRKIFTTLDNTGTDLSGEYRIGLGIQHANLFGLDHVATFNYITAIDRPTDINLYSGSYRIPLYSLGDSIDLFASKSDVGAITTTTVAGPLQFAGNGEIYGWRYNLLLPRLGEYTQRLILGMDYRQFKNACSLGEFGPEGCGPAGENITVVPASLTYTGHLDKPGHALLYYLSAAHNVPGMENGMEADFHAVRPNADGSQGGAPADYYALRGGYSYTAVLGADWQMRLAGNAQYSSDPLVYVEQFSLAGSTMVRGFWEREVTRDMGYVLNTEIYTPDMAKKIGAGDYLRGLAFFDYGSGRNNTLAGEDAQEIALTSVGVGLRFGFNNSFQLKFDGAYVLDGADSHRDGDARAHLAVYMPYSF